MGERTAIAWTDATFNPWWGCERVSPGCQNCYAETFAKRTGNAVWGRNADRRRFGDKHWQEPVKWNRQAEAEGVRRRVFCASMADVFEDRDDHRGDRARLFELVETTPWLDWQLLTKRPENVCGPNRWLVKPEWIEEPGDWPRNCWVGTTVEDQKRAEERIPHLLAIPAPVRFLSCEPLLGEVHLSRWLWTVEPPAAPTPAGAIHWVIAGGESGPRHRPLDLRHARILQRSCANAGVPFFFKQVGGLHPTSGGDLLDGVQYKAFSLVSSCSDKAVEE